MKKPLGTLLWTAAMTMALLVPGTAMTLAQAKKAAAKAGTIELIESKDGKFRFSIRDAEGKYLGGSAVGHATEKEAKEAVEEMKKVLATATYVSKKSDEAPEDAAPKKKAK